MAGTVSHVLHVPFLDALGMNRNKLTILTNEAERQRALDTIYMSMAFGGDKDDMIPKALRVHGPYTIGFFENEHDRLMKRFGGTT